MRALTLVPVGVVAIAVAEDPRMRLTVVVAIGLLAGWSALYVRRVLAGSVIWPSVVDAAIIVGLAMATPWVVPGDWLASSSSWLRPFTTFAAVGYQYSTPWPVGVGLGGLLCLVGSVSTQMAQPGSLGLDGIITGVWSFLTVLLARLLWTLVVRAGRRADDTFAAVSEARRAQVISAGIRADQRAVTNALHDTAASTLLMVGLGRADDPEGMLRRRAKRDLETLRSIRSGMPAASSVDLCSELRLLGESEAIEVVLLGPDGLKVAADVAQALIGAVAEALANVRRHAGTDLVLIKVTGASSRVSVEVRDRGTGFDTSTVPATRRGVRDSIQGRLRAVGGAARVDSLPGAGTVVRLVWPDD
jgi:hypothetical protein